MTHQERVAKVRAAMAAARENGYDVDRWGFVTLACDMATYDADLEDETIEDLSIAIREIRSGG